jgi:hypothetical protein
MSACAVQGQGPEDGLDLVMGRAAGIPVLRLAFIQRGAVVSGVAEVGVGAVGEQPADAAGGRVGRCPLRCAGAVFVPEKEKLWSLQQVDRM